jgi:ubiquinone/menaquinone biosynthesis C-methylase UbiE
LREGQKRLRRPRDRRLSFSTRVRRGSAREVRDFWEQESCGERYGREGEGVDYDLVDSHRYRVEPMIPSFASFATPFKGRALEIGLGVGSDYLRNTNRGGQWFGLDVTERSLKHVRRRAAQSRLIQGDAQVLPFATASFDYIYSWGVLLCCPDITEAIAEVNRVLRIGGRLRLMLYHSPSWVALAAWARWGWWRALSPKASVSYMESAGTQAFSVREAERLLASFSSVNVQPVHTSWDERWTPIIGRLGGDRMGWFLLCEAQKQ